MTPLQISILKYVGVVGFVFLFAFGFYSYGRHTQATDDLVEKQKAIIVQQEQDAKDLLDYANKLSDSIKQHEKDATVIASLNTDISRMHLTVPTLYQKDNTSGTDETSRLLSIRVQEGFDRFKQRVDGLISSCDQLNIDTIQLNSIVK